GTAVRCLHASAGVDLAEDGGGEGVARAWRVRELLAVGVEQRGAGGARRLGDRVALHVRRPGAAVRVVLKGVEIAGRRAELEGDLRHLAGRSGMVGRKLAPLLRLAPATPAGGEDDRGRLELVLAAVCAPPVRDRLEG